MIQSATTTTGRTTSGGFTLFEVGLSLVIVTFSVVTVLMFIPTGIRAQQKARFQLLASAKALELIEQFSGKSGGERIADFETPEPWEARPFCYSSTRWDLECRVSRWDSGVIPMPTEIAMRLDSDGDEIQRLNKYKITWYTKKDFIPGIRYMIGKISLIKYYLRLLSWCR